MDTHDEIELGNYWRIFRRSWWLIVLAVLSMIALALVFLPTQENYFTSEVSVLLKPGDADVGQGNDQLNEETEIGIAISPVIGSLVAAEEVDLDVETWQENLLVTSCLDPDATGNNNSCDTGILQMTYRGDTADDAARVVQSTADSYLQFRIDRETALREASVNDLREQLADVELRIANEAAALRESQLEDPDSVAVTLSELRLRRLQDEQFSVQNALTSIEGKPIDVGSLLGNASPPEADATGIPRTFALLAGLLMGLLIGGLLAIMSDRLDRRISSASETESDLGVPVLGDIPRITEDSPALVTAVGQDTPGAEAFRRLAATALAPRNGFVVDSIAITGANEKEGRTTIAINLALAISQTGRNVLLVGADRRNDAIDRVFGLASRPGLSDYLRTSGDLDAARAAIDAAEERLDIKILPTGTGAPTPLSNNAVSALLAIAQELNMIVVFDAPPALTHAEGLQIAAVVDAVYVVSAMGRTRRSELTDLRVQLVNVQADLAGAILNRTSRLNLLPTGSGEVGMVSVPTGIPGNNMRSADSDGLASVHPFGKSPSSTVAQASPVSLVSEEVLDAEVVRTDGVDVDTEGTA